MVRVRKPLGAGAVRGAVGGRGNQAKPQCLTPGSASARTSATNAATCARRSPRLPTGGQSPRSRRCMPPSRWGPVEQDWFLNACARIETDLGAMEMLGIIAGIESNLGRERKIPNGPRTIDIDLLLYADLVVESAALTVPHPRLHLRRFVLEPLAAIAPDLMHPRLRKSIADLLKEQPPSPRRAARSRRRLAALMRPRRSNHALEHAPEFLAGGLGACAPPLPGGDRAAAPERPRRYRTTRLPDKACSVGRGAQRSSLV